MSTVSQPALLNESTDGETRALVLGIPAPVVLFVSIVLPWLFLWNEMRVEWSVNEQYGYGWFVPPFAAILFWLRWADAPPLQPPARLKWLPALMVIALLLILPLRLIEVPNPRLAHAAMDPLFPLHRHQPGTSLVRRRQEICRPLSFSRLLSARRHPLAE
ncbi:MAG: archaeosortase/exosortase family protein [Chthoniobacterales bacterium]